MTSATMNLQSAPEAGPLHTPYQCCHKKCICSKLHDAFESLSSLATVALRNLEQDTQYGPILLNNGASLRAAEEGLGVAPPPPVRELMFPRYWGYIRFVQAFVSFFSMVVFSVYIDKSWGREPFAIVLLVFAILAMLYSILLGYIRLMRPDWCPWLIIIAPLIFVADLVTWVMHIITFAIFPRALRQGYYYYDWRQNGFVEAMWIPTTTINFLLYILTTAIALHITCLLVHQNTYSTYLDTAKNTYQARRSKEKKVRELARRILDGSLNVVSVASRPEERATGPSQTQVGYVAAQPSAVALIETGGSSNHVRFPTGPSYRQEAPTATTTFHVNHTSSRPSKFTLTTQEHDQEADSQRCCRMCGEHGPTNPPEYIHTAVAALPQIPLASCSTNTEVLEDDNDDESTESTGLLKRSDTYQ